MQIQMIGTGNAFGKKYYNNNAFITTNTYTLLVDCGITAPTALHELKIPMSAVDGILITHIHGDHVGGLEELAFQMQFIYKKKITLFLPSTLVVPLWENTLKAAMENKAAGKFNLHDYFHVIELEEGNPYSIENDLQIEIFKTEHIPEKPSYSLVFNDHIFYSSDVQFDRQLINSMVYERSCNIIFHDCQLQGKGEVHATLQQLLTLPEEIQQLIYLMHYGDEMEQFKEKTGLMQFMEQHKKYSFPINS